MITAISRRRSLLYSIIAFAVLFAIWCALTYTGWVRPLFLPSPSSVAEHTIRLFTEERFLNDIAISVYRVFGGFLVGSLLAIPLGIGIGLSARFRAFVEPLISFLRYMPAAAFIPLAILWLGIGDVEKMFIIFVGTFPYLTLLVTDVVLHVDHALIQVAQSFGARRSAIMKYVIIPAALPGIWDALRVMAGIGWTYIIVAEIVAARSGIGHVIIEAQRYLKTPHIIIGLIIIGILGVITDWLFKLGYRHFFPYSIKTKRL